MPQPRAAWSLEMGITKRGCQDVGSVVEVQTLAAPNQLVNVDQPLLRIEWEGHTISDADELYHTKWGVVQGSTLVRAPMAGLLKSILQPEELLRQGLLGPDIVVANMHIDRPSLQQAQDLVDESTYSKYCSSLQPGRFANDTAWSPVGDFVF